MGAADAGHVDVMTCLIEEFGALVNQVRSSDGCTPLIIASVEGSLDGVRCLLKFGANINQANNVGTTPLLAASVEKYHSVCVWLVKAGADTRATMVEPKRTAPTPAAAARES
jgi:ankyrin repeat protein